MGINDVLIKLNEWIADAHIGLASIVARKIEEKEENETT
jgi:hypothetical protein